MERKYQLGSAIFFLVLGIVVAWEAQKLKLGRISRPDPGFFPFLLGVALAVVALVFLIQVLHKGTDPSAVGSSLWHEIRWTRVLFSLLAMLGYALGLDRLGYLLTTFILLLILFRHVGSQSWWVTILGSTLTSIFTYVLFKIWLQVQLPIGLWGI